VSRKLLAAVEASSLKPEVAPFESGDTVDVHPRILEGEKEPGGGPVGLEMAQAHRRLGSRVTVIEAATPLSRDDAELAAVVLRALRTEGVDIMSGTAITRVACRDGAIHRETDDGRHLTGSHLLIAAGRRPNVEGLGLENAGVAFTAPGITVDTGLRTTNRRVYAVGDVAGGRFTHEAGYQGGIVIRNALFGLPAKVDYAALPCVTYADPELAHVGLTEAEARQAGHAVSLLMQDLAGNDRAQAEGTTEGLIKVVLGRGGRILGATIVAPRAGEMIGVWGLAIQRRLRIGAIASSLAPYPTMAEISKRAAGGYYTPSLFGPRTRRLVGLVQRWLP
jgi:pyruvate/2-oxoglutarate dehydrogenase complex dihydrolipoamide dehydrogenase (E3) component